MTERAQPGTSIAYPQPVVWLDRDVQLHSFAGFAGHGGQGVAGRVTHYSTAFCDRKRVSSQGKARAANC
jgi:hypothetical protein